MAYLDLERRGREDRHQKEILKVEMEMEDHQEEDHQVVVILDHGVDQETALEKDRDLW